MIFYEITLILLMYMYADDMTIVAKSHQDLQTHLNVLKEYYDKWAIQVNNTEKCSKDVIEWEIMMTGPTMEML